MAFITVLLTGCRRESSRVTGRISKSFEGLGQPACVLDVETQADDLAIHVDDPAHMVQLGEKIAAEGRRLQAEAAPMPVPDTLTPEQLEESYSRR